MRARLGALLAGMAAALALAGCGQGDEGASGEAITVVATTTHVGDFVRQVGGDRVEVRQILSPQSDPHEYEPRPSDARSIVEAEVVFRAGGDVDGWLEELLDNAGGAAPVVTLSESLGSAVERPEAAPRGDRSRRAARDDPHWWQDPRGVEAAVAEVRASLTRADSEGAHTYRRNAAAYTARLRRLDRAIAACMRSVPRARRKLVTTHDAFGPFASRYGIELIGALVPALSTEAQPSAGETARLARRIEREGVEAIFPERGHDPELERALARETGARLGDALWADALGGEGSGGESYLEATASNARALVEGFTSGRRSCRLSGWR